MSTPPPDFPSSVAPGDQVPVRPSTSGARIADVIASVILMVAGFLCFAVLAFMSLFLVMMSDGCFGDRCNTGLMSVGWLIALGVPPVVFLAAAVWTIIRLVRRKISWWVAAVGAASGVAIWFAGVGIMNASLGR